MFTEAVRVANEFTYPYVGLRRRADGHVFSTMGAFIVLNADGWILTAGHLVDEILGSEEARLASGGAATDGPERPQAAADHVEIWALPGFAVAKPRLVEARVNRMADVALCRLEPFDADTQSIYPTLRDTAEDPIQQGMSVCRLGFPFHDVSAGYSVERREFELPREAFPVPRFALDGVVARFHRVSAEDGSASALFIETSTPGLRGQSGGPLLDVEGRVCGVQSHTTHLDLGFDARFQQGDVMESERQFLNVGAASHVDEVRVMLDEAGVSYAVT